MTSLHSGDQLTRAEFERRWQTLPGIGNAELVDGTVYVAAPVRQTWHGGPHATLVGLLWSYAAATPGIEVGDNSSVRLDDRNMPQPDAFLRLPERAGGRSKVDADDYLCGAPELIVEVAASSVSYDLHQKLQVYERFGVREYVVHRTEDRAVDWFVLRHGRYEQVQPDDEGLRRSSGFPGLWLDVPAVLAADLAALRAKLERGLCSSEHTAFAAWLRQQLA